MTNQKYKNLTTNSMDLNSKRADVNYLVKVIKDHGYIVVPEFLHHAQKWEIVVIPWDFINSRKRHGVTKRTGYFFAKNECVSNPGRESRFEKAMKEVQLKLVEHFSKTKN